MAIKINTTSHIIPIEFGAIELKFDMSDKNMKKIDESMKKINQQVITGENEEDEKEVLKDMYDSMFGEGSFDLLYEQTPSTYMLLTYFMDVCEALGAEQQRIVKADKMKKYLNA